MADYGFLAIYDFAVSDSVIPDSSVPNNAYTSWWHETYLPEFPKPYRNEAEWSDSDTTPFGFRFISRQLLELTHTFGLDSFIEFMLIQSNVNAQIESGSKTISDVRNRFHKTLVPVFQDGTLTVKFTGYLWVLQKIQSFKNI